MWPSMLFSQESNMLDDGLFATGFGAFGCFDGGIATDENGQNGAEGTADRHGKKGVVQPHRHAIWRITPFRAEQIVNSSLGPTSANAIPTTLTHSRSPSH